MPRAATKQRKKSASPAKKTKPKTKRTLTRYERIFIERLIFAGSLEAVSTVFAQSHQNGPASYSPEDCQRLFALPRVQKEYKTRLEVEAEENARQMIRAKRLHDPSFLDAHVVENVENSEAGSSKTSALKLGYIVTRGDLAPKADAFGSQSLLDTLFNRMSIEEMDRYAKDGALPPWFTEEVETGTNPTPGGAETGTNPTPGGAR